jgi:hypothetical protein
MNKLLLPVLTLILLAPLGCSVQVDVEPAEGSVSASSASASSATGGALEPPAGPHVRLANVVPWIPPLDFCLGTVDANGKGSFGPKVLASMGRPQGIKNNVSAYVAVGQANAVRVILADSDCSKPWIVDGNPVADTLLPASADRITAIPFAHAFIDMPQVHADGTFVRALVLGDDYASLSDEPFTIESLNPVTSSFEPWFDALSYGEIASQGPAGASLSNGFLSRSEPGIRGLRVTYGASKLQAATTATLLDSAAVASLFVQAQGTFGEALLLDAMTCLDDEPGEGGLAACTHVTLAAP